MPIYMDLHHIPEDMNLHPEDVENAHHADMEIQDEHGVSFLTYWFDQKAGAVFCLVDAPDADAIRNVHGASHGLIPNEIIEVDLDDVQTFLGRISDPPKDEKTGLLAMESPLRTIMFTDLKGSTEMTATMGDATAVALFGIHDEIIRKTLSEHGGTEIKHTGDGFMIAFTNVADSVHCAVAIQNAFKAYNTDSDHKKHLHVRVGLNAGQPVARGGDLFGIAVNLAARICDHCHADKILATGVVRELLNNTPTLQARFTEVEKAYFKGFAHAIQIFEIEV